MLDPKEIEIEIARLEYGESSYPAYAKLANLYTIREQMEKAEQAKAMPTYNYDSDVPTAAARYEILPQTVGHHGDTEFLNTLDGKDAEQAWLIMDNLMDTLHTVNPRVYESIIRKIRSL